MEIKVLGPGCPKCKQLDHVMQKVATDLNLDAKITKVEDIMEIMSYGVMSTPALVVDGKVVIKGRVPGEEELKNLFNTSKP
jgi:small redox-active disulfide protein 2